MEGQGSDLEQNPASSSGFHQFVGRQVETAALSKALSQAGAAAAHTWLPYSEAMLFGIGGGLGLGYFVYESGDYVTLFVGTRLMTQETPKSGFVHSICERLGVPFTVHASSSISAAERKLIQSLDEGSPVLVWVDPRRLPYYGTPNSYHPLLVQHYLEGNARYQVSDRSAASIILTTGELNEARQGEGAPRFRALTVHKAGEGLDLSGVVSHGLRECLDQMLEGFGPANFRGNFGLSSLKKWAGLMINTKDRRGWPKFFPEGERLFSALVSVYEQVANRGADGDAFRSLFADFLDEAAGLLPAPGLDEPAALFRAAAEQWRALSEALLPESEPLFGETRRLLAQKKILFEASGAEAVEETQVLDLRLGEIRSQVSSVFPLTKNQANDLLSDLYRRVLDIHDVEAQAVKALGSIIE